jgi:polyisoprenoid-binding protein YceI
MATNKWIIDPAHSEIQFRVKHLMISTVTGHFKKFNLEAITEGDDFSTVQEITFTIETDSIDTNNKDRDAHLKSVDFFNSEIYPAVVFNGAIYTGSDTEGKLTGDLSIRDVVQPVELNVEFGGMVVDPYGQTKAGITVEGKINRRDFGLTWGALTETGNVIVGDEVKIHGEIQLIKK